MSLTKVLLVDDEPGILSTLSEILRRKKYDVTIAPNVRTALDLITKAHFDVLISDLNIGELGDGFTVVSAMRRTHPESLTMILTGFPAFDSALEAIRNQVDEYLVKPASINKLLETLEQKLNGGKTVRHPVARKRLPDIIRQNKDSMILDWQNRLRMMPNRPFSLLPSGDLVDHLPMMIEELCRRAELPDTPLGHEARESARKHGELRRTSGHRLLDVLEEARALRQVIIQVTHSHLLELNLSTVFVDIAVMSTKLDELLRESVIGFNGSEFEYDEPSSNAA